MSATFIQFRQNNSGGSFHKPSVNVYIEAASVDDACKMTEPHFSVCGDSGRYADYDDCGCCPCCGHRWSKPWSDGSDTAEEIIKDIDKDGLLYMRSVSTSLIKADGSIIIGNTEKKLREIKKYILAATGKEPS